MTPTDELILFRGVGLNHQPVEPYMDCFFSHCQTRLKKNRGKLVSQCPCFVSSLPGGSKIAGVQSQGW